MIYRVWHFGTSEDYTESEMLLERDSSIKYHNLIAEALKTMTADEYAQFIEDNDLGCVDVNIIIK